MTEEKKTMKFTTIEETLYFLNDEYQIFKNMDPEAQAINLEYNEEIRKSIDATKSLPPLRTLYVDLCMYDQMIQQVLKKSRHKKNTDNFLVLMTSKIATQHMIAIREEAKESIVPDELIEQTIQECKDDPEKFKNRLIQWIPSEYKKKFTPKLETVWKKNQNQPDCWEKVLRFVVEECIHLHMNSVENFRSLFSMVECIMMY